MTSDKTPKKLYRSNEDKIIAGVCGGLGTYFNIDSVIFRVLFVLLLFAQGIGALIYILLWVIVPMENSDSILNGAKVYEHKEFGDKFNKNIKNGNGKYIFGLFLVVIGLIILISHFFSIVLRLDYIWPIALIFIGLYFIFKHKG